MGKKTSSATARQSEADAKEPNCKVETVVTAPNGLQSTETLQGPMSAVKDTIANLPAESPNNLLQPGMQLSIKISCDGETKGPEGAAPAPTPPQQQNSATQGASR